MIITTKGISNSFTNKNHSQSLLKKPNIHPCTMSIVLGHYNYGICLNYDVII